MQIMCRSSQARCHQIDRCCSHRTFDLLFRQCRVSFELCSKHYMFLLQQSCRASRLLRGTAHLFDTKFPFKACAAVVCGQSSLGRHADWIRHDLPGAPSQDAFAMLRGFLSRIDNQLDLRTQKYSPWHSTQSRGWAPHDAELATAISAQHATCWHKHSTSAQPPPLPQPPSPESTAPPEQDPDLRDEADHERLSRQLEDAHGPATDKPPLDAFKPLNSDGPHSRESVSQAAVILKVRISNHVSCCDGIW